MLKTRKQNVIQAQSAKNTTNNAIQVKDVCRICLNSDGTQYTDIFSVKFIEITLVDFVYKLTQIPITVDDGYPHKICTECIDRYKNSYSLCNLTKESFEKLKSILSTKSPKNSPEKTNLPNVDVVDELDTFIIEIADPNEDAAEPAVTKIKATAEPTFKKPKTNIKVYLPSTARKQERDAKVIVKSNMSNTSIKEAEENGDDTDGVNFLMTFLDNSDKEAVQKKMDYDKRPYACKTCGKRFLKRSNLLDHLRLHANVKNFKCPYCDKSFVQSGNYKSHLRVHTNERPYACSICTKSYQQSSALKIHFRSHTNEKKYVCDKCEKGFTNSSDLSKHKLIHDEVKKFQCEICTRGFSQKIHLTKHLEKGRCTEFKEKQF